MSGGSVLTLLALAFALNAGEGSSPVGGLEVRPLDGADLAADESAVGEGASPCTKKILNEAKSRWQAAAHALRISQKPNAGHNGLLAKEQATRRALAELQKTPGCRALTEKFQAKEKAKKAQAEERALAKRKAAMAERSTKTRKEMKDKAARAARESIEKQRKMEAELRVLKQGGMERYQKFTAKREKLFFQKAFTGYTNEEKYRWKKERREFIDFIKAERKGMEVQQKGKLAKMRTEAATRTERALRRAKETSQKQFLPPDVRKETRVKLDVARKKRAQERTRKSMRDMKRAVGNAKMKNRVAGEVTSMLKAGTSVNTYDFKKAMSDLGYNVPEATAMRMIEKQGMHVDTSTSLAADPAKAFAQAKEEVKASHELNKIQKKSKMP